jgi:hypothetical protein
MNLIEITDDPIVGSKAIAKDDISIGTILNI